MLDQICEKEIEEANELFEASMAMFDIEKKIYDSRQSLSQKPKKSIKGMLKKSALTGIALASLILPAADSRTQETKTDLQNTENVLSVEQQYSLDKEVSQILEDIDLINYKKILSSELRYSASEIKKIYDAGIPVVMLHYCMDNLKLGSEARKYNITPERCREMLEFLYENNYVPISAKEYAEKDLSAVARGKWPVALTFDDSSDGQLTFLFDKDGMPTGIDPKSCVGIINKFAEEHPDFRAKATFFINFEGDPKYGTYSTFRQEGWEWLKLLYLKAKGYDVQDHFYSHKNMGQISYKKAIEENVKFVQEYEKYLPVEDLKIIAWPYGVPAPENVIEEYEKAGFITAFIASGGISKGDPHNNFYKTRINATDVKSVVAKQKKDSVFALFTSEKQKVASIYKAGGKNE